MPALTDIEQAREMVLERTPAMPAEEVAIGDARGRVLAEAVDAGEEAVPGFDNSAMDGYAVRAADAAAASEQSPVSLRIAGESRAGHPADGELAGGEAIAISTGAMVPAGADAVVRVEDTRPADGAVEILAAPAEGLNIRRAGEDVSPGDRLLEPGVTLGAAELGVAVSVGRAALRCARRPRVSVLATGDELVGPDEPLFPGAVRNSNMHTLPPLAIAAGADVAGAARVRDTAAATHEAIAAALASDVVIVSGGVSVGAHDHVRPAFAELGVEQVFWGVSLRPGKPTYFGVGADTLVFGLPGNPVSAIVTFLLFARPAIRRMLGAPDARERATATLTEPYAKRPGRAHAIRVRLELADEGWRATPTKDQGSHVLTSMLGADALAYLPAGAGDVAAGERVEIELLPAGT
ncbi:MAG TPA: gephyrin-like molybdotransferase Glp [Solirubrobacterales bacterium]